MRNVKKICGLVLVLFLIFIIGIRFELVEGAIGRQEISNKCFYEDGGKKRFELYVAFDDEGRQEENLQKNWEVRETASITEVGKKYYISEYSSNFETEKEAFHSHLDALFGREIKKLFQGLKEEEEEKRVEISMWRIANEALCNYEKYYRFLDVKKEEFEYSEEMSRDEAIQQMDVRRVEMSEEIRLSRKAIEISLYTFSEIATTYPLHLKYQKIIENLEDYRDDLGDVRQLVNCFPSKFVNASTTNCD